MTAPYTRLSQRHVQTTRIAGHRLNVEQVG